jgi:hypothetical protein
MQIYIKNNGELINNSCYFDQNNNYSLYYFEKKDRYNINNIRPIINDILNKNHNLIRLSDILKEQNIIINHYSTLFIYPPKQNASGYMLKFLKEPMIGHITNLKLFFNTTEENFQKIVIELNTRVTFDLLQGLHLSKGSFIRN